jgi:hypothetical protein
MTMMMLGSQPNLGEPLAGGTAAAKAACPPQCEMEGETQS